MQCALRRQDVGRMDDALDLDHRKHGAHQSQPRHHLPKQGYHEHGHYGQAHLIHRPHAYLKGSCRHNLSFFIHILSSMMRFPSASYEIFETFARFSQIIFDKKVDLRYFL
jgi:hypothetical protein